MSNFIGGSAFAMASQIAEGYLLLNIHHLKRIGTREINELKFELQKVLQDTRSEQPPLDQIELLQKRNRKISRINTALMMLNNHLLNRKGHNP